MFNFLDEPLLTTVSPEGCKKSVSLAGCLAGLTRGTIMSFSSLRFHQQAAWHVFLVQIATLALENADENVLPGTESAWRDLLRGLTPQWPNGEPWSLVIEDITKPALMQAPVPGRHLGSYREIETPDGLDMLI